MYRLLPIIIALLVPVACYGAGPGGSPRFEIVFDSNRSGNFGIYRSVSSGGAPTKVIDTAQHEMFPAVSPDGRWIAFARTSDLENRDAYSEIFLIRPDGSDERLIIKNATYPTFTADGAHLIVQRRRRAALKVAIKDGSAEKIFPKGHPKFKGRFIVKPQLSPDGTKLAFHADLPNRWNAWFVDLKSGASEHIGDGCEPVWIAREDRVAWVQHGRFLGGSAIRVFDPKDRSRKSLVDFPHPHGYEYFPSSSADGRYVVYGAAREGEHSHNDSNYQIFVADLAAGTRTRITEDKFTNRWPQFLSITN